MKISKLTASLLTSTAVFAGVLVAQGQSHQVSADSKLRVDYSSNLRQNAGTDAKIIGGLKVGETYSYDKTAAANGYTWYEIGNNKWVASAGTKVTGGQVEVNYASNKRVGPSTSNKIAGGYYPGQKLTFTETVQAGGYTWYKVGTNAWVASAGVSEVGVTAAANQAATTTATTTTATAQPAATTTAATTAPATTSTTTTPAASTATTTTPATTSTATTPATTATTTTATSTTPTVTAASGKVQTTVASNVRSNAGTKNTVTGSLPAGTVRSYTATAVADGYTWYQVGTNQWVAGAKPYTGTATATTTTTPATTSQATTSANTTSQASTTSQSSNTASSYTANTTTASTGTQTAKNSAGNTYAWGQCTWYVKSVASWAGNYWGNGAQWGASAAAEGFTVNHTPSVGSIVVVAGGQNFGGWTAAAGYGHVAYVVGVNGNSITVQQGGMGFANPAGPNTQTVSGASNFTYIHR